MKYPVLTAQTAIAKPAQTVREWFLSLQDHPERYRFASHEGFFFDEGGFGAVGARFHTIEHFSGLRMTLHFALSNIGDWHFSFDLQRPISGVWGTFGIEEVNENSSTLTLNVGSRSKIGRTVLHLPLIRQAVQKQIQAEVEHVRTCIQG